MILDDDDPLQRDWQELWKKKVFSVKTAKSVEEGLSIVGKTPPKFALIDLRLEDGNGLDVVKTLSKLKSDSRIVMLTGMEICPLRWSWVKVGAIDYIAKPVDADDVEAALLPSRIKRQTS